MLLNMEAMKPGRERVEMALDGPAIFFEAQRDPMSNQSDDIRWCEAMARSLDASAAKSSERASDALREISRLESRATEVLLTGFQKAAWQDDVLRWKHRHDWWARHASWEASKAARLRALASELSGRPSRDLGKDAP
jgi:hypothetical protein